MPGFAVLFFYPVVLYGKHKRGLVDVIHQYFLDGGVKNVHILIP